MKEAVFVICTNAFFFYLISKILPGFEIKKQTTLFFITFIYTLLISIVTLLVYPFTQLTSLMLWIISIIPLIGPIIAATGAITVKFIVAFFISMTVLTITDIISINFKIHSFRTTCIASFILAILNMLKFI